MRWIHISCSLSVSWCVNHVWLSVSACIPIQNACVYSLMFDTITYATAVRTSKQSRHCGKKKDIVNIQLLSCLLYRWCIFLVPYRKGIQLQGGSILRRNRTLGPISAEARLLFESFFLFAYGLKMLFATSSMRRFSIKRLHGVEFQCGRDFKLPVKSHKRKSICLWSWTI